jgi:branched-chain amino acid aminotransferase
MTVLKSLSGIRELGFGQYFCPTMAWAHGNVKTGWSELRFRPMEDFNIHPAAKVLHYGQEVFEGLKAFRRADGSIGLFRPRDNIKRMTRSAEIMAMLPFPEDVYLDGIVRLTRELRDFVPNEPGALYLRPTLVGTSPTLGVAPSQDYLFYVLASPVGGYFGDVASDRPSCVSVWVDEQRVRAVRGGLGAAKTGANYAASLRSVAEAKKRGFHNVLFLDALEQRKLEELSGMNVFVVDDGKLITPPLGDTILAGVTRDSLLKMAKDLGIPTREEPIEIERLVSRIESGAAVEFFACGTGASITALREIGWRDRRVLVHGGEPGPVTTRLYRELLNIQYGRPTQAPVCDGWIVTCD